MSNNYTHRTLESAIMKYIKPNKAVIILGARRVGKTELTRQLLTQINEEPLLLNGDDESVHNILEPRTVKNYERVLGKKRLLVIDEAQSIPQIGMKLKLMLDSIEGLKIIATGSSVFDLNKEVGEPLVGRKMTFTLHPFSQQEIGANESYLETQANLFERLIFGSYPELTFIDSWEEKIDYLKEQVNSYLLKDILEFDGVRKSDKILSLLRIIAFRVGSEISVEGIANDLQINKITVDKYLDLLSKVFIIHKVTGYSRNLDNEITKKNKWYFYDNGIRNALINNFNSLSLRDDHGKLWENYIISERIKHLEFNRQHSANFFWRTHTRQKIDWVEEKDGHLSGYEIKWNPKKTPKAPSLWRSAYPEATYKVISPENYLDFIS